MSGDFGFQDYSIPLAAGGSFTLSAVGNFVKCKSVGATIKLRIGDGPQVNLYSGRSFRMPAGLSFDRLEFMNDSGGSVTAVIDVCQGEIYDDPVLTGDISIAPAAAISTAADVSITAASTVQVVAGNSSRRAVVVGNLSVNTQVMRIGDSNAGAARGAELSPGEKVTLETTAAVYAYNPGGAAESLSVMEIS